MDNVIFEDPSKQRLRLERPLQVLPVEVMPNQHDATYGEQQNCAPSQSLRPYDLDFTSCGRPSDNFVTCIDGDKSGLVHGPPDRSHFDPVGATAAPVHELYSMSEDDYRSVDEGWDSLFSSPEPEVSVSATSASSGADKLGAAATSSHFVSYNQQADQGKDARLFPPYLPEEDVLDGDAENWMALHNEVLESGVGAPGMRIRSSIKNNDVEPCTESDNSERAEDLHHATRARNNRQCIGSVQLDGRNGSAMLSNRSHRTDTAKMVIGIQQYTLNGTRRNAQQTASPIFPLSRNRRGVALPDIPLRGSDVNDDQVSCLEKVSPSWPYHNRRATQKRRPQRSPQNFPPSEVQSRSMSCDIPLSSDEGQHNVEKEVVWEYRQLLDYRSVNGKSLVLVPWLPTWEPADEYPPKEVDRVRRNSKRQMQVRRRGRPHSKQNN